MIKALTKRMFPFLAVLLLAPWPVVYAYDVSDGVVGDKTVHIEVTAPSAAPGLTVFGRAVGGVTPGELFYIDATKSAGNIAVTLYLTDANELVPYLRYLILEVGVYVESSDGEWKRASWWNGEPAPDIFITLDHSRVSFTLAGCARYKVAIDGGSFYCISANNGGGNLSPRFYLVVDEV